MQGSISDGAIGKVMGEGFIVIEETLKLGRVGDALTAMVRMRQRDRHVMAFMEEHPREFLGGTVMSMNTMIFSPARRRYATRSAPRSDGLMAG